MRLRWNYTSYAHWTWNDSLPRSTTWITACGIVTLSGVDREKGISLPAFKTRTDFGSQASIAAMTQDAP